MFGYLKRNPELMPKEMIYTNFVKTNKMTFYVITKDKLIQKKNYKISVCPFLDTHFQDFTTTLRDTIFQKKGLSVF